MIGVGVHVELETCDEEVIELVEGFVGVLMIGRTAGALVEVVRVDGDVGGMVLDVYRQKLLASVKAGSP